MGAVKVNRTIEIENPFEYPLQMTFSWETLKNWETNAPKTEIIEPGQAIKIDYSATSQIDRIYPFPTAKLHFQTPDGKMAFKNNTVEFYPIKIGTAKLVKPFVVKKPPVINGELSDIKLE